jgi:AcrR family transcriptional regulator
VPGPRERMLAEAFILFYANGIRAVGVDLLIARAGVAKASFYRYFRSKRELILAYVDLREDAWLAWLQEWVEGCATSPNARLLAIFDALGELFTDPEYRGCAAMNAVAEVGNDFPDVLDRARHHTELLNDYVGLLASQARLPRPADIADQWVALIRGAMAVAQCAGDGAPARAARQAAARLLQTNGRPQAAKSGP